MRLIKSIRFGEKTKFNFTEIPDAGGNIKNEKEYDEKPLAHFVESMQNLVDDLVKINQLKPTDADYIAMSGITLTYKTTDLEACLLLGKMSVDLCNAPRNDKTPLFSLTEKETDDGHNVYRLRLKEKIADLCHFANKFIDGDREKIEKNDTQNMFEKNAEDKNETNV